MEPTIEIIEQKTTPVMSIRTRSSAQNLPKVLGEAFGKVAMHIGQNKGMIAGPPFTAYYNMDMEDLDIEVGFPVAAHVEPEGDVQQNEIPECKAATCLHVGPYETIAATYEKMSIWLQEQKKEPKTFVYEMYLNDPQQISPEALQTKILFPLKD